MDKLKEKISALEEDKNSVEEEAKAIEQEIKELDGRKSAFEQDIKGLQSRIQLLTGLISNKDKELKEHLSTGNEDTLAQITEQMEALSGDVNEGEGLVEQLMAELKEKKERARDSAIENESIEKSNQILKNNLKKITDNCQQIQDEIDQINKEKDEALGGLDDI